MMYSNCSNSMGFLSICEIEVMKLELSQLHQMGLIDQEAYIEAAMVLRREHRLESDYQKKIGDEK